MHLTWITLLSVSLAAASPHLSARDNYGATATFYWSPDCQGASSDELKAAGDYDNSVFQDFDKPPVSMRVQGTFNLVLHENQDTCSTLGGCCAYCINYNDHDCGDSETSWCVNIDTGYDVTRANLMGIADSGPADLPCNNFQYRCAAFPQPPANGMCENEKKHN